LAWNSLFLYSQAVPLGTTICAKITEELGEEARDRSTA